MSTAGAVLQRLEDRILAARDSTSALEIRGGRTKRFYGNVPRGEPLEIGELAGITSYEPTELVVTVLAGTRLAELESVLADHGQCLPFEPPHFAAGGTVGGMVAAGIAGPARAYVGPLRDYVLGVTMLNGMGERLTFGGQVMKNVAGYDVSRIVAGSMGILGVICEVSLKVMPKFPSCRTFCFDLDEAAALRQLNRWAGENVPLNASAWHHGLLYLRLAGANAAVARGVPGNLVIGHEIEPRAAAMWWSDVRDQRHAFFSFHDVELERGECLWRLAVPDTTPPIALPGEQFIEWGGGQRWWRSTASAAEIRSAAERAGGHATLMRGADKRPGVFTAPNAVSMAIHQRLKQAFDPAAIFNPERLYPEL